MTMQYGDSTSETFASGPVGKDRATLAGLSVSDQKFAAIDNTTNPIVSFGNAGIFGLGFPGERSADSFLDTLFFQVNESILVSYNKPLSISRYAYRVYST